MFSKIWNWIKSIFVKPVPTNYTLGKKIFEEGKPWKISCLTNTKFGLFIGTYNGDSRTNTRLYLNGIRLYDGRDETIGQGLVYNDTVYFAGENGNLLIYNNGKITKGLRLVFASTCAMFTGKPYVFNSDNKGIHVINCLTGLEEFKMPGAGIVTMSIEDGGKLYTSACDGDGGIACNDGTLIKLGNAQCLVKFGKRIICSSGNKVMEKNGNTVKDITTLACEKIMHMDVNKGLLWVAGSNPDALWIFDSSMNCKEICNFKDKVVVGGSVFRSKVTSGFFGRALNGTSAEVYEIK